MCKKIGINQIAKHGIINDKHLIHCDRAKLKSAHTLNTAIILLIRFVEFKNFQMIANNQNAYRTQIKSQPQLNKKNGKRNSRDQKYTFQPFIYDIIIINKIHRRLLYCVASIPILIYHPTLITHIFFSLICFA